MPTKVALTDVIIELHVPNFNKVMDFYGKIGFEQVWKNPPKRGKRSGYLVIKRQNSILCFYCGNEEINNHPFFKRFPKTTPRGYGVEIAIYISDQPLELFYQRLIDKLGKDCIVEPLKIKPWGSKDFRVVDPFGFYLCFREAGNILRK